MIGFNGSWLAANYPKDEAESYPSGRLLANPYLVRMRSLGQIRPQWQLSGKWSRKRAPNGRNARWSSAPLPDCEIAEPASFTGGKWAVFTV